MNTMILILCRKIYNRIHNITYEELVESKNIKSDIRIGIELQVLVFAHVYCHLLSFHKHVENIKSIAEDIDND